MANTFEVTTWMVKEALRHFENQLTLTRFVDKDPAYLEGFTSEAFRPGTTINIPKPHRAVATSGAVASFPDITEEYVSLTVGQYNSSFAPLSIEMATSVQRDQWSERYIKPHAIALANQVDSDGFAAILTGVGNAVGTAGTTPNTFKLFTDAMAVIDEHAAPMDGDRAVILNPAAQSSMVDVLKGLFQSSTDIAEQYKTGKMGTAAGGKWSMDQNVAGHTTGQQGGTPLVNGGSQTGATLACDGWTASAANRLKKGDSFTIAGVNAVNPVSKTDTGRLQTFVVTADTSSDGGGAIAALPIYPPITVSGSTQTVTASPADNAVITCNTASVVQRDNIVFHKKALTMVSVPMPIYKGLDLCVEEHDPDTGITMRIVQGMDITNDKLLCRLDVLYGWCVPRGEWACKVLG